MEGKPALYKGRIVSKENFRAWVYMPNGNRRLVESWDEFEATMQTGVWFATLEDAKASVIEAVSEKPKTKARASKPKKIEPEAEEEIAVEPCVDESVFEVKDDFLPRG